MATWNPARGSEAGDLIRLLPYVVSFLVTASCVSSASAPSATASPTRVRSDVAVRPMTPSSADATRQLDAADTGGAVWRFAGTLLPLSDPNSYANVILDVEPLKDGGWIVVEDRAPSRSLPHRGPGTPFKPPRGTVLRLDSAGLVVARQSESNSFSPTHIL